MKIMMTRGNGRVEDLRTKENLIKVLKATNKKDGSAKLNNNQYGAIANTIMSGKTVKFCGRKFEVYA